jgi:hypothetical protein
MTTKGRCCACNRVLKSMSGQTMELHSLVPVNYAKRIFNKEDIAVGDIVCPQCRPIYFQKRAEETEKELDEKLEADDPTFELVETPKKPQTELVEMEFLRVVATHGYCFLCGETKNIVTVPFEARKQTFARKQIFVPKGKRCIHGF